MAKTGVLPEEAEASVVGLPPSSEVLGALEGTGEIEAPLPFLSVFFVGSMLCVAFVSSVFPAAGVVFVLLVACGAGKIKL